MWGSLIAAAMASMLVLAGPAPIARAEGEAESIVVDAVLAADGTMTVTETITFAEGDAPSSLTQRLALTGPAMEGDATYHYTITDLKATADGQDLGASVTTEGDYQVMSLDATKAGAAPVVISYAVAGAAHPTRVATGQPARTTASWRLLQGLSVGATTVSGTLQVPGMVSQVDCKSGPPTAPTPCGMVQAGTFESPEPMFEDGPRGPGEVVVLTVQADAAMIAPNQRVVPNWSLDRAFSLTPLSAGLTLGSLLLGGLGLWLLHRRAGRDLAAVRHPTRVAEFAPVGEGEEEFRLLQDVRPGHVGTVTDERVDPIDVTGTLLDLAVRGHLRIHELDRPTQHHPLDWSFERRDAGRGALRPYEQLLRDAVAPEGGEPVKVSQIASAIGDVVPEVQSKLYDDVVEHGWFDRRPDDARDSWTTSGWVALTLALVIAGLLVAFTPLGLWGIALVALALGVVFVAQEMPRRSAKGSELLAGLQLLATDLQHHRTDQMPRGREHAQLSRILPYAVVLGGSRRWLDALAAEDGDDHADGTDLDWYHAPDTWHLSTLPVSVEALVTSLEGHLFGR